MKILIAYGDANKYFHLKEFGEALSKLGVEYKLVKDIDYVVGFPSKKIKKWIQSNKKFKKLVEEFVPDAIFVDRQNQFGVEAIKAKIPLFVLLRGHVWDEVKMAKKTLHKGPIIRSALWFRNKTAERCFKDSTAILPICSYLENIVKEHFPNHHTAVFFEGMNPSHWYQTKGTNLKHPCVGLLQHAFWWGKTKEMLVLKKALKSLPDVHFYWAGFGKYEKRILEELKSFDNFHWMGAFPWKQYPDNVRDFLSEIDIYALPTGMDLAPLSLKEAQLMKKPVLATDVGGVSEMMLDKESGFLIEEGNSEKWVEKISFLLKNENIRKEMGNKGNEFVTKTFNWEISAKNFLQLLDSCIAKK